MLQKGNRMGFNKVAFLLNDFSHEIIEKPNQVIGKLTEHYSTLTPKQEMAVNLHRAVEAGEELLHSQALQVFPSFHANNTKFYMAGGNCCNELEIKNYSKSKGRKTVTLILPDWA